MGWRVLFVVCAIGDGVTSADLYFSVILEGYEGFEIDLSSKYPREFTMICSNSYLRWRHDESRPMLHL